MIVRLTQKLAQKLKLSRLARTEGRDERSAWYAHLFRAKGVQYIVMTESKTLSSVLFSGKGITNPSIFMQTAKGTIETKFNKNGWAKLLGNGVSFDNESPVFMAAQDHSILSCVNDVVRMTKWEIEAKSNALESIMTLMDVIPHLYNGRMANAEQRATALMRGQKKKNES